MRFLEICSFPWTTSPNPSDCAQDLGCVCTQEVLWRPLKETGRPYDGGGCNAGETTAEASETETYPQHTGHTALYTSTSQQRARGSSMFPDLPLLLSGVAREGPDCAVDGWERETTMAESDV